MKKLILFFVFGILLICLANFVVAGVIIWSDNSTTPFIITDDKSVCYRDKPAWISWDSINSEPNEVASLTDCYRSDVQPSTCCPIDNMCDLSGSSPFSCTGGPNPEWCSGYETQEACKGYHPAVGEASVERFLDPPNEKFCGEVQSRVIKGETCRWEIHRCRCEWVADGTHENDGTCEQMYNQTNIRCEGDGKIKAEGACLLKETKVQNNCETSRTITFSWESEWSEYPPNLDPTGDCDGGSKSVPCIDTARLDFFTNISLIIAIFLLVILYAIIVKKKKKYKGKKGKKKQNESKKKVKKK